MSRFERASHVIWHCQYHVVWVPKYRFRMLQGPIGKEVQSCLMIFCQQLGCEIMEMNVQVDHVHLLVKVPPKLSKDQRRLMEQLREVLPTENAPEEKSLLDKVKDYFL